MQRDSLMVQILFIGFGAGVASAVLYASTLSGSMLAILLAFLSPLPILIAALGWSHWAGLVAAITASAGLAAVGGFTAFLTVLISFGLSWWLGYLALLARPAAGSSSDGLEWYPAGSLVVWTAIAAAVTTLAIIPRFGLDAESFYTKLRTWIEPLFRTLARDASDTDVKRVAEFFTLIALPGTAIMLTLINLTNLWLAARIVRVSGRLRRPWPDLTAITFPSFAPALLGAAVVATFISGLVGLAANVLTASLLMAYAVLGFAVLHAITRGNPGRVFALGGAYAAVCVFGWPTLGMTLLGLADSMFDIRGKVAQRRGPPPRPQT
jgi:hypothetical protein